MLRAGIDLNADGVPDRKFSVYERVSARFEEYAETRASRFPSGAAMRPQEKRLRKPRWRSTPQESKSRSDSSLRTPG
jgi:hypothetical protein